MTHTNLRLIPQLSIAALKTKQDKEIALWYCLRAINSRGSAYLVLKYAIAALVSDFGYSQATVYRTLKAGCGKFWDIQTIADPKRKIPRPVVQIYALKRVARYLDTFGMTRFLEIPALKFKALRERRSWLYSSFHQVDGARAKPISRRSISEITGITRRSQQRYDKLADVRRVANFAFQEDATGKVAPILEVVAGKAREYLMIRRLGNTYHNQAVRGSRGMIRKVNRELRQSLIKGEACQLFTRFFFSSRSFIRSPRRHEEPFILVNRGKRLIKGRQEWCLA